VEVIVRVLVCGSRDWTAGEIVHVVLSGIWQMHVDTSFNDWPPNPFTVITGGAKGADSFAAEWAEKQAGVDLLVYRAKWEEHGKAAGPIRNQRMLEEGKPDCVVAFSDLPVTTGTADMIRRAKRADIVCWQVGRPR
jgi:hypothetical protein